MEIIKPVTEEDPDPYKQRLDRLREKSKELQMGWCDNKKDLVKQLAEKFLTNTTKVSKLFKYQPTYLKFEYILSKFMPPVFLLVVIGLPLLASDQ